MSSTPHPRPGSSSSSRATPYEPPVSVWAVTKKNLKTSLERIYMREILGESLVDQTVELHAEVDNLLEIWREFREETTALLTPATTGRPLPEPPEVRFRLKKEIQFYVEALQSKAEKEGRQLEQILRSVNEDVLRYALDDPTSASSSSSSSSSKPRQRRPSTGRSGRDGRETPLVEIGADDAAADAPVKNDVGTSAPDRATMALATKMTPTTMTMTDDAGYVEIIDRLRSALEAEAKNLYKDIDFLQSCLESESDFRSDSAAGVADEPTLTDLKEQRTKLERQLLEQGAGDAFGGEGGAGFMMKRQTSFGNGSDKPSARPFLTVSSTLPSKSTHTSSSSSNSSNIPNSSVDASTSSIASSPFLPRPPSSTRPKSRPASSSVKSGANDTAKPLRAVHPVEVVGTTPERGPAARQPFGSTNRLRIRDSSPLKDDAASPGAAAAAAVSSSASALSFAHKLVTVEALKVRVKQGAGAVGGVASAKGGEPVSDAGLDALLAPTPPPTPPIGAEARPSSAHASRFRKMVLQCRDDV